MIGNNTSFVTYSGNGNISTKSNVGGYTYDPTKVNAVSNITVSGGIIDPTQHTITYNASNLTTLIEYGATLYNIQYNPFGEKIKTVKTQTGNSTVTKYYSESYEKKIIGTAVTEYHYINSPYGLVAIIESIGTSIQNIRYIETDHLGSKIGLLRSDKSYAANLSFDAWGRRRNPANWTYQGFTTTTLTDRGFTGHEHLDWAGLINANGRMYDPVIGRFLGVDPIVADGDNSQSFNSYTYALNNPLRLIDRDGFQYEEPYSGGLPSASISTWSLETWREMKRLAKANKELSNLDCVGIATGYLDSEDVLLQRLLQLQYGHSGQGGSDNKRTVISFANGTAAYGGGGTFDVGGVIDASGNSKMYLTLGVTAGFGATGGFGFLKTNSCFNVNHLAGGAVSSNFTLPIKINGIKPFGGELFGDWIYGNGKFPGNTARGGGFNIGIGGGYFVSWTFTFLCPVPPNDFWNQPSKHF